MAETWYCVRTRRCEDPEPVEVVRVTAQTLSIRGEHGTYRTSKVSEFYRYFPTERDAWVWIEGEMNRQHETAAAKAAKCKARGGEACAAIIDLDRRQRLQTGYYGRPGHKGGKTHIHDPESSSPVCGTSLPDDSAFQFCSKGMEPEMVECEQCREWMRRRRIVSE